jgi:hypothetical protein
MGQLGDVLEMVFGRPERFQSVRATIRQWEDIDLAEKAQSASAQPLGRSKGAAGLERPESQRNSEKWLSVWMCNPSRARVEARSNENLDGEHSLLVTAQKPWVAVRCWRCAH